MTIAIGNDHAGTIYKFEIIKHLEKKGYTILNFGTDTNDSMDYPDAIHPTAPAVESGKASIITIPARFVSLQQAIGYVDLFLDTAFEGGRHGTRVDKISC